MASIDFPTSPTDGQKFTTGDTTYTYVLAKGYWDVDDSITTLGTITEKTSLPVGVFGSLGSQQKIQASANLTTAQFGYSVSISGDGLTAIVGANGTGNGAAYIYTRSTALSTATWTQQAKIVASDGQLYDYFGESVSISSDGNTVVVGADYEDPSTISSAGAAYIFTRSGITWSQQAKIQASDPEASDNFGWSVSISGDGNTVIVGALNEDTGGSNAGAAYIFTRSGITWSQQAKIQSTDIQAEDYFGYSVSISSDGNTAIVGAWYEDNSVGAAYIFIRSGTSWSEQAKIQAGDKQTGDQFGVSVSISDDGLTAIIGANGEDTGASAAGAAYIFTRSGITWSQQAKIQASDPEASDNFGWSVSISSDGNTAIVSAWIEDPAGTTNAGSAYVFKRSGTTWTETQKIQASDAEVSDYFGMSVGISGDGSAVIVGARGEDTGASDAGAAYIYAADISSIVLHDISQSSIFSHSGLTQDITANFTNVPTTNDRTIEIELVIEQGATGYLPTAIQIDDVAQTFVWENGVEPTPSVNASDVIKFTLLRSSDTWTVLASLTRFTDAAYPAGGIALTDFSVGAENPADGDGGISYDNTTGVFTYTPPVVASGVDSASVEAAGALMDSELTDIVAIKALDQGVATTDSPTFAGLTLSGVPTAPTAAAGTNTTQIATTEFTTTAIANLVDTAPATLDTLNELAAALGDDSNFATTVANSLALKAPLISPSFTGPVTVTGTTTLDGITTLSTIAEKTSLPVAVLELTQLQKILASDAEFNDWFGFSVAISSDGLTAIIGAKNEDTGGTDAGAAYILIKSGSTWSQQAKIQANDKASPDQFGHSVDISSDGNTAIISSPVAPGNTGAGRAYIFVRSGTTWSQQAQIQASDAATVDYFGWVVSISSDGNTAIVGAYKEDTGGADAGAAYIFTRSGTTWTQQAKIQASDAETLDFFGISVSISGDGNAVIVGAQGEDTGASGAGAAYIFVRSGSTWTQQAKIQASDAEASDNFGNAVSISGDGNTAIVGVKEATEGGYPGAGAVYIFTRSVASWTQAQKIIANDIGPDNTDYFGYSVDINYDGNKAAIGARLKNTEGLGFAGAAYTFTKSGSTWSQQAKIVASDPEGGALFGESVSISNDGNTVLVGASSEDTTAVNTGAAYIFTAEISSILHDISESSIFTHSNLSADFTANFTNVPTTNDRTTEIELVIEQGATGYLPTAIQIDGAAQTFVWENGTQPEPSINASDVVKFTLLRSADAWTVLASLTRFTDAAYPAGGIALTDFSVGAENPADGDGAISYDNTTGVFTYTPPVVASGVDAASVEAAGALMDSELTDITAVKALDQGVATTDSPTFAGLTLSGVPTAPTAAAGTNTTQIATTEFTTTAINNLVDAAPGALDTLNELAAALGDDSNFATTVANSLALKAPLISPSFTGPVTVTGTTALDGITTLSTITETTYMIPVIAWDQQAKIQASDPEANDQLGHSVSISSDGNTAIVGARFEDTGGSNAGAVYIYVRSGSTWTQQAKIQASDIQAGDEFGFSVSISGDGNTAIVGARGEDTGGSNAGAAYIFVRSGTTWSEQAKIQSSDIQADDYFGHSVSISSDGNTAIVGALNEDSYGADAGAVYIFTRSGSTWSQQAKIQATDKETYDYFGYSVSISSDGNTVIVGANGEDTGASGAGAAYIFVRSGTSWTQQAKIQASDPEANDYFGTSVSISSDGNTAIVGAYDEDTGATDAGAAYIFTRSGTSWTQQAKIQASDKQESDRFGWSVGISSDGNTAIVCAYREDTGATDAGAAYIFVRSGISWSEQVKIQASDPGASDYLGFSVSISDDGLTVIVGAYYEDTGAFDGGAAYIFSLPSPTYDISQSSIFTHSGLTANITANFTNVPTTNDRTIEIELVIEQGAIGYLPTAIQIDGVAQTFVWENGVEPTPSVNASDVVKFTLLRSADTWTVLASLTRFTDAAYPAGGIALTDLSVGAEAAASGDGGIAYDNSTGVFTYTPPVISAGVDAASVEAAGALMDSELTDIASIKALDQGVATTDSPSFAGLTLSGVPTAPTAAPDTSTTQIATTEFTTTAINEVIVTATNFVNRIYDGDGVTNTFVVTSGVTSESILVSDNGVVQRPVTDYSVSGTTLTFVSAPLTGSTIQIREIPAGIRGAGINTGKAIAMSIVFGG